MTGITYDIDGEMPDGGITRYFNQVPAGKRTSAVDIEAEPVGTPVIGRLKGDYSNGSAYVIWFFKENVYWGECGGNQPPPGALPLLPEFEGTGIAGVPGPGTPGGPATVPGGPGGVTAPGGGGTKP